MTTFKTITQELLEDWTPDGEHSFDIYVYTKHFVDWFNNMPETDEYGRDLEFKITKGWDDTFRLSCEAPYWWSGHGVDRDELDLAVLDKLYLKPEWVDAMPCNG